MGSFPWEITVFFWLRTIFSGHFAFLLSRESALPQQIGSTPEMREEEDKNLGILAKTKATKSPEKKKYWSSVKEPQKKALKP